MKTKLNPQPAHVYIIGAGGIGGQLLSTLLLTLAQTESPPTITIIDGDTLEARNLHRQLFTEEWIGKNKAEALCALQMDDYPVEFYPDYFYDGFEVERNSLFFCCVDNHPARRAILSTIDRTDGFGIFGGNEYTDEEAYFYKSQWKGTELDPRVYYPDILTDQTGDPMTQAMGCTGDAALAATPQLAIANKGAAFYMLKLFWFYFVEAAKLDRDSQPVWPIRFSSNFSRCTTARRSEFTKPAVA